jgi:pimeloyl-ACP methyl ester carboxylesterase
LSDPGQSAVLFVHGAGGGGWEWNVWARVFAAAGFAVHAPDLQPVAGGLATTRLADYSEQVRTRIERSRRPQRPHDDAAPARRPPVILIGASLGGLLALMNAELADALVLINPMPPSPLNAQLPGRIAYPATVPWRANASLESTRRALPDADEAAQLYAFRNWRDESGAVMNAARAGVVVQKPTCPMMVLASEFDADVPAALSAVLAQSLGADLATLTGASHVGPLLGKNATCVADRVVAWLNGIAPAI